MLFLAVRIELGHVVPVQRSHDADPGQHGGRATCDKHQGLYRVLPLRRHVLSFEKFADVIAGVLEGDELAAASQRYRIFKWAGPVSRDFCHESFS